MKNKISIKKTELEKMIDAGITEYSDRQLEDQFCEMVDDSYSAINIVGYTYEPSFALRRVDPIAFREAVLNYIDSEIGESLVEIEQRFFNKEEADNLEEEGTTK